MIKNLILLRLRALIAGFGGRGKNGEYKKPSRGKIILFAFIYAYVALVFIGISIGYSYVLADTLVPIGATAHFFGLVSALAFALVFIFSIFETKSELFDCKDNDLMLSMPIKPGHLVISRILVVLIYNFMISAVVTLPATVMFAIISDGEPLGIAGSLLTGFMTPLLATSLASAVGYIVAVLSKKMKNKTFVTLFFSILFLGLYFWGYTALIGTSSEEDISLIIVQLTEGLTFLGFIGKASLLNAFPIAAFCAVSLGVSALAYFVISKYYFSIVTASFGSKRKTYKSKELSRSSALMALVRKELSCFVSSAVYMLNTGLGFLFGVAVSVFALVKRDMIAELVSELAAYMPNVNPSAVITVAFVQILVFLSSMTIISSCALSLEGNNLWVLKSMPISGRDVLLSKAIPHILLASPVSLVCSFLLIIAGKLSPAFAIFVILIPLLANIVSALVGVALNVAFPKFVFNNEAEPIKQSMSAFLTMLTVSVVAIILCVIGVLGITLSLVYVALSLMLVLLVGLSVLLYYIVTHPCVARYETF